MQSCKNITQYEDIGFFSLHNCRTSLAKLSRITLGSNDLASVAGGWHVLGGGGRGSVFCSMCCQVPAPPYLAVVSDRFRCSEVSYTDLKIKNLNNCFLKDITKLYFATKIFSLPDDKCLRNSIVANWLLFQSIIYNVGTFDQINFDHSILHVL